MIKFRLSHLWAAWISCLVVWPSLCSSQNCADPNGIILVTNTDDEGPGSLRAAMECANITFGSNSIHFDIPGILPPYVIEVGSTSGLPLPTLIDPATFIDARTQQGYIDEPIIVLDGGSNNWSVPIDAIAIGANFCQVYGFEIRNFPDDGIDLIAVDYITIRDNYIHDNGDETDYWSSVPNTGPWEGSGVVIGEESDNNIIAGNIISNNEYCGIRIRGGATTNLIGGPDVADRNEISENAAGIWVSENAQGILIQQNSMFCNDTLAIELRGNANNFPAPPEIASATPGLITGTAEDGEVVEVFINNALDCPEAVCQGSLWLGTTVANNGAWSLGAPFENNTPIFGGNVITATARDVQGNTSEFAACTVVVGTSGCTNSSGSIFVTNTQDMGPGSLRSAIDCANNTPGANTIKFNIPGNSDHTIYIGSETNEPLPALTDIGTVIDGTSQSGFGANGDFSPKIILDGSAYAWTIPINAVWIKANYCEMYGIEIVNFPDDGIEVNNADYIIIGDLKKGNIIYNNGAGIDLNEGSDYCEIKGNMVGTNYYQTNSFGNENYGIIIQDGGDNNFIVQNTIAHHPIGIQIDSSGFQNTMSQNSLICNDSIPVALIANANDHKLSPQLDSVSNLYISGYAEALDFVEVFINVDSSCADALCQGGIYLGTAIVLDSSWVLQAPFVNDVQILIGNNITATATDVDGNTSAFSDCVETDIECNLEVNISNINPTTCGLENGSFTVNPINGTAPFSIDIGNGPTTETQFEELFSGTYSIIVTDQNNCTAVTEVVIEGSTGPEVSISDLEDAHCNEDNGMFNVDVVNGQAPYQYDIGNGPQSDPQFSNLSNGIYLLLVTDAVGCSESVEVIIEQTGNPEVDLDEFNDASCNEENGFFSLEVENGVPPYQYDIGNGPQTDNEFSDLAAGIYTVTVTDENACTNTLSVSIGQTGIPEVEIGEIMMATCNESNGSFAVNVSGGIPPYQYDIGNGPTSNNIFENLAADNYSVTITDGINCMQTVEVIIEQAGIPQPLVSENNPANCDQDNGSFSVQVSEGIAPYQYDIGDGPTSNNTFENLAAGSYFVTVSDAVDCTATIAVDVEQTGIPLLEVSEITNETCLDSNGSIELSTTGGGTPYLWDIGNGLQASPIFSDLPAGAYTITVTDDFGCTAEQDATLENEDVNPTAGYFYTADDATITFVNNSAEGDTYSWSFGDGNFSTLEHPVHTYEESGDYLVCLSVNNVCGVDAYCEFVSVIVPLAIVDIGGEIAKENGQTVSLVEVACSNNPTQTTETDGLFLFEEQETGLDYLIEPEKDINYINGCSTFDLFLINQHILEIDLLDSPYKIIAADIDNSGSVTAVDLIRLQQVILFVVDTFPNNTSWRFVPEDYVFIDPLNPLDEDFPESIELLDIDSDELDNDFVAIKIGDVNLSSNPAAFTEPEDQVSFEVRKLSEQEDELFLEFKLEGNKTISAFEISMKFDPRHLEFEGLAPQSLIHPEYYFDEQNQKLHLSWFDQAGLGLESENISFKMRFRKQSKDWIKGINLSSGKPSKLFGKNGEASKIYLKQFEAKASDVLIRPNPFVDKTRLYLQLNESTSLQLKIFNLNGQIIYQKESTFNAGENQIDIDLSDYPVGLYFYQLGENNGRLMKISDK